MLAEWSYLELKELTRNACRGNQGPGLTGSNGNAGPISAQGLPIDPAAETYKRQVRPVTASSSFRFSLKIIPKASTVFLL